MTSVIQRVRHRSTALIAALAIVGTTMTFGSTPAQASDDALLKFLLGATAVAIVVHAASRAQGRQSHVPPGQARGLPRHCRETLSIHRRHVEVYNANCLNHAGLRHLPEQCYEVVRTNYGHRAVYRARCLERNYNAQRPSRPSHAGRGLPSWCSTQYTYQGQRFRGYLGDCLRREGIGQLPGTCRVASRGGDLYSASCLSQQGFRVR
jgi:hypothetical protein